MRLLFDSILPERRIERKLDLVLLALRRILTEEQIMSAELDALTAQVKANESAENSAIVLIQGLAQKIQDLVNAGNDPAALLTLATELKTSADALGAAVVANTPPPANP